MERDDKVRVVVITGAGKKAFAAGADISELNALASAGSGAEKARRGQGITRQIERLGKPVVMAINGFALGGGCELAMAGDIRIASENAKFGQPEVNLGLIPVTGGFATFDAAGRQRCCDASLFNGRNHRRAGSFAHRSGDSRCPRRELMNEAKRIATLVASKAPLAIAACKRVINNGAHLSIDDALELEALEFGTLVDTEDIKEGTSAFLEKRKPAWKGR